jgi:ribosomal protein S18 acetylase RimI-like enzyme
MNVSIRKATEADAPSLSRICPLTADAGTTAEHLHIHGELLGLVYALPYVKLRTTFGFVAVVNEVVGYVVGSTDTRTFEREAAENWWPPLQKKYPVMVDQVAGKEADERYRRLLQNMPAVSPANITFSPAHLHINILPPHQRKGLGRRLIGIAVEYLKAEGIDKVWVGMDLRNTAAKKFYERLGFCDIETSPPGNMGLDFENWRA